MALQEFDPQDNPGVARSIGEIVDRVTLLVHDEIELAKTEILAAVQDLLRGTVAGVLGGIFAVFGLVIFLQAAALFLNDLFDWNSYPWLGYLVVAFTLFIFGGIAAFVAMRKIKKGSQLTPELAIAEARKTQEALRPPEPIEGAVVPTGEVVEAQPPAAAQPVPAAPVAPAPAAPAPPAPAPPAPPVSDKTAKRAAKEAEKARAKAEKEAAKARAEAEKQAEKARQVAAKQQAEAEKQAAKEKAEAEKQAAKAKDEADKQAAKAKAEADKQAAKARKQAEKQAKKDGKKSGGKGDGGPGGANQPPAGDGPTEGGSSSP